MPKVRPLQVEALEAKDERQIIDLEAVQPIRFKGTASRARARYSDLETGAGPQIPHEQSVRSGTLIG